LLFGSSEKWDKLEGLFNYTLPEVTELYVEGCLSVDGEDYIIKRTLIRPQLSKRNSKSKVTHKVDYYRVVGDSLEDLEDYVDENGVDSRETNKIIKETIGREDDFDLMMCITGSNLDSLINEKPTERGRLFSRWIGLLPLEEKDVLAREKFNQQIKPYLLSNRYNRETLSEEITAYGTAIKECETKNVEIEDENKKLSSEIDNLEETKKTLISSKQQIDSDVLKIDIITLRYNLQTKKSEGIEKKTKLEDIKAKINELGEIEFSVEEYDKLCETKTSTLLKQQEMRNEAKRLMSLIKQFETSEYCPTCGRKLDNVDNSKQIQENKQLLEELTVNGKKVGEELVDIDKKIDSMKEKRQNYMMLNTLNTQKSALEVNLEVLRNECRTMQTQEAEYKKNSEAIDKNNSIDISIRNTEVSINEKRAIKERNLQKLAQNTSSISEYKKAIDERNEVIKKINEEEKLVYNWKIYLDMVGKNGISKMVMRNALPIINARMTQLLDDVCDFDVSVEINNKNEVVFNIIRDGIVKDLNSGSGFEKTASALALRSVLSDISTISKMNFIVLDEILGRVASENYDKMQLLYDRILSGYDFVFHITHINDVKDWHNHIVTVVKNSNGVSSLRQIKNIEKTKITNTSAMEKKETKKATKKQKND
jgi:DNA repair exonuclease SbcCD ATPase subunit